MIKIAQLIGNIIEICKQAFYTKTETDTQLENKSDINHTHDYVTTQQLDGKLKQILINKVADVKLENGELVVSHYEDEDL